MSRYLILGGSGTLGNEMIKQLLANPETELVRCLSRDELKLSELARRYKDERLETVIGDVRDKSSICPHFYDISTVFHFCALKRVPEMEAQPIESLKTNVLGTINSAECALENGVDHFIFSSTDKAARPINAYGACKFLSEKILFSYNQRKLTNFSVYRWTNIINSRGAVSYAFKDAIENDMPAYITHPDMSRGWIRIEDAVKFVLSTYESQSNEVKIPYLKGAKVLDMLNAIGTVMGKEPKYVVTGLRGAEKLSEDILYDADTGFCSSTNTIEQYTQDELISLAKEIVGSP